MRTRAILSALVLVVYLLHQDCWNWTKTDPLLFGFLPVGLAYHAGYCLVAAVLMAVLVKFAWPKEVDDVDSPRDPASPENMK
jgi:hypothetical protein